MSDTSNNSELEGGSVNLHSPSIGIDYGFNVLKDEPTEQLVVKGAVVVARLDQMDRAMTPVLREYAKICVALMTKFEAPRDAAKWKTGVKGYATKKVPDWGGRSEDYQSIIEEIYRRAGVGNSVKRFRNNLAYHRQNYVKEVASPEELVHLHISKEKRTAGGTTNQTEKATGATKKTGTTITTEQAPVKVMERILPQIIQLEADVVTKKVVKTAADKKKLAGQLEDAIKRLMAVHRFLVPRQTEDAAEASAKEEERITAEKEG